jgi:hypothetical protein
MPIIPFLKDEAFDPDHIRAMSTALGQVSRALGVKDQRSLEVLATRIIELARRGERSAERLKERVLQEAHSGATANETPPPPWYSQIKG